MRAQKHVQILELVPVVRELCVYVCDWLYQICVCLHSLPAGNQSKPGVSSLTNQCLLFRGKCQTSQSRHLELNDSQCRMHSVGNGSQMARLD